MKLSFSSLNLKKYKSKVGYRFANNLFFSKIVLNEFCDFIVLDPDPHSSNFVDKDRHTINADPHHYINIRTYLPKIIKYTHYIASNTKFDCLRDFVKI